MEMSRKSGQRKRAVAKKLRDQVRRNVAAGSKTPAQRASSKAAVTKRGGTTTTYKPKPSPHLKPKPATKKAAPKPVAKKAKKSDAQKLADYRKNPTKGMAPRNLRTPAQRAALKKRLKNQMSEAGSMTELATGLTEDIGDAKFATELAITMATLPIGGGLGRGALTGAKAIGRGALTGAKATGQALKTGAQATGRIAKTGLAKGKRATRIARIAARKADRRLLKAQGLSRQGGKVRKIKKPNPFGAKAAKGAKPKVKSDKKNPFAGQAKPKRAARKAKKAEQQDAHVKAWRADRVKKGRQKAESERQRAVANNKRAAEKAEALRIEKGYAQQKIDARKASRNRRRKS